MHSDPIFIRGEHVDNETIHLHRDRLDLPQSDEVGRDGEAKRQDIILNGRNVRLQSIDETHSFYDAHRYPGKGKAYID